MIAAELGASVADAVDRLVRARPPLLVIADFDGTLAPGSRDPGAAVIDPVAQRSLRRLARVAVHRPTRVATIVLTGRTVADVAARVRVGGIDYLGDHGLQHARLARHGRVASLRVTDPVGFDDDVATATQLGISVAAHLGSPAWLFVEPKGPSVAFHVRQADDVPAARAAVLEAIAAVESELGLLDHGLEHYRGRSVVDLRPRAAGGKREAVERSITTHRPGAVVVFGDELSDVDAFEAVITARALDRALVGVTVAVHGAKPAPDELRAVADVHLPTARSVGRFLAELARRLES